MKTRFVHSFLVVLASICCRTMSFAQLFSFEDTTTTIIKNTNQSPAHWYLEITSNCIVDTTLRWKAHFDNIPTAWNINFDCQNQNWPTVLDGDSSNFTMFYDASFPQKLIIGAELNNTPGHGTVYFDIYDPLNPTEIQTIAYEFIIGVAVIDNLSSLSWIQWQKEQLIITDNLPARVQLFTIDGKLLFEKENALEIPLNSLIHQQSVILVLTRKEENYRLKLWVD